jgi:hypothetical protein
MLVEHEKESQQMQTLEWYMYLDDAMVREKLCKNQ